MDRRHGCRVATFIHLHTCWIPRKTVLFESVEWSLWRILVRGKLLSCKLCCIFVYSIYVADHTLLYYRLQAQVTEDSWRTIDQHGQTTREKKQKRAKDGHCYRGRVCTVLVSLKRSSVNVPLQTEITLWHLAFLGYRLAYGLRKLCHQPLYLLHFQFKLSSRS